MNLELFADEFLVHRKYLRARLHLRPIVSLESVFLHYSGGIVQLKYNEENNYLLLFTDELITDIGDFNKWSVTINYKDSNKKKHSFTFNDIVQNNNTQHNKLNILTKEVHHHLNSYLSKWDVLEIGSRHRDATKSYLDLKSLAKSYTGIDIVDGPNVDVVGDAHKISSYFKSNTFDFVYSQ